MTRDGKVRLAGVLLGAALLAAPAGLAAQVRQLDNGLARTPPMGFNTWNKFACNVSEDLIKGVADAMVATGMRDAGYRYVVIDDCWQVTRDSVTGRIVPDAQRFPNGMRALADYIHAKGLLFGLYTDAGRRTCEGRPGSYRSYEIDARTYAEWGVDYTKVDWCYSDSLNARAQYTQFRDALLAAGRPIVFSICEWGSNRPWEWAPGVGNLWRTTGDITDRWWSMIRIADASSTHARAAGPGGWNDPDMLEVGNGGMSVAEYRAHFSFWCLFAAPLMAGNDLKAMAPEIKEILTSREAIAIDQDPLGMQGRKVRDDGPREVWMKPLADGSRAVILWTRGSETSPVAVEWQDIGLFPGTKAVVHDLWKKADVATTAGRFEAKVGSHDVAFLRITPAF